MSSASTQSPLRILLVEDDESHADLIRRGLEDQELATEIDHVRDGEAALDYLLKPRGLVPDLILLDIRLPRVNGLEVLRRIRESDQCRLIPTVMLTTSDAPRDMEEAYHLRANSYLVKPLDFERFMALVGELGLYWTRWNQRPAGDSVSLPPARLRAERAE